MEPRGKNRYESENLKNVEDQDFLKLFELLLAIMLTTFCI